MGISTHHLGALAKKTQEVFHLNLERPLLGPIVPFGLETRSTSSPVSTTLQVAETCQLAVRRLEWLQSGGGDDKRRDGEAVENPYCSVDPAPPHARASVDELRGLLLDESLPLFERYRAMFALRNLGGPEAVLALGEGERPS